MDENITKLNTEIFTELAHVEQALRLKNRDAAQNGLEKIARFNNLLRQAENVAKIIEQSVAGDARESMPNPTARLGTLNGYARHKQPRPKPVCITIGTSRTEIRDWNDSLETVANWIIKQGRTIPTFPNFILPSEEGFASSAKTRRLSSGQFIELGDSKETLLKKARRLLDSCGFPHQTFEVTDANGTTQTF